MPTDKKRSEVKLQQAFLKGYFYQTSDKTGRQVARITDSQETVNIHTVKSVLNKFRNSKRIESEMLNENQIWDVLPVIVAERYQPEQERIYQVGYHSYLNSWSPPHLKPSVEIDPAMVRPQLWQELLSRWFSKPDEAAYFEKFLAFMVRKPLEPADVAVVLRSQQGAGKNFLWDQVISPMAGKSNAPTVSLRTLTAQFAADLYKSTAMLVDECYSDSKTTADKLKGLITGRVMRAEEKNEKAQMLEKFFKVIITSNSNKPLHIEQGDRRYWVPDFITHKESKEETAAFLATMSGWLDAGGLQELRDWFELVPVDQKLFRTAPDTHAKTEIMARDKTADYQLELRQFLEPRQAGFVFSVTQLQQDRFKFLAEKDIAAVLNETGFTAKRRNVYGKARLWEHPSLVAVEGETPKIWSAAVERSTFR
jgi:hypothetical protein